MGGCVCASLLREGSDMARLSEGARAELERRVEVLRMELRLVEAELRGDEALRVQEGARERAGAGVDRGRLRGGWRDWVP
jgi:hypothetical protein